MKYNQLGTTSLKVSEICLGTMTWGTQNSQAEAHAQLDYAVDHGVNFVDTAELYPTTPLSAETQGRTEEITGTWLKARGKRDKMIVATKITGKGPKWIRGGVGISPAELRSAVEGSLKRLQIDTIDLYQLHWPNRGSYHFRQNWRYDPSKQNTAETKKHIVETLSCLKDLQAEGKIRYAGLSNETCWGAAQFLNIAEQRDLPRMVSIQNEYNLMCRQFDLDWAELAHHESVGLLAYSPLATGLLTGKYDGKNVPEGSRLSIHKDLGGRYVEGIGEVLTAYQDVAKRHGVSLTQMSMAFCLNRPFMTSVIIGATTIEQLQENIAAKEVKLSQDALKDIDKVYRRYPMPF